MEVRSGAASTAAREKPSLRGFSRPSGELAERAGSRSSRASPRPKAPHDSQPGRRAESSAMACWKARGRRRRQQRSRTKTGPRRGGELYWALAYNRVGGVGMQIRLTVIWKTAARGAGVDTVVRSLALPEVPRELARRAVWASSSGVRHQLQVAQKPSPCVARATVATPSTTSTRVWSTTCHLRHRSGPARSHAPAPRTPPHRVPGAAGYGLPARWSAKRRLARRARVRRET